MSLEERQEFFRLYDILLQGEENYRNRQAVAQLLGNLSSMRFQMPPPPLVSGINVTNRLLKGEYAVRSAIRSVLIYETFHTPNAEFQIYCPQALDLTTELLELWLDGRRFSVNQLLGFSSSGSDAAISNLFLLRSVIPLCLASKGRYCPYYFCEHSYSAYILPFGYYIVTPHYVIQFAEDLSTAQIQAESDLVEYFRNHFLSLLLRCEQLTRCSSDIRDTLEDFIAATSPDSMLTLMAQPCPGRYFTKDFIAKYMNSGAVPYEQLFVLVEERFSVLRNIRKNYYTIFTEKGLREFAETGVMCDMPPEYVPPLEKDDVRMLLQKLRDEIADGSIQGLIARPTYLQIPDYLVIDTDEKTGIHIYSTNDFIFGAYCCNIHLTEESICQMFLDFIRSLPGSQMVYSLEDTLHLLDHQIHELDARKES